MLLPTIPAPMITTLADDGSWRAASWGGSARVRGVRVEAPVSGRGPDGVGGWCPSHRRLIYQTCATGATRTCGGEQPRGTGRRSAGRVASPAGPRRSGAWALRAEGPDGLVDRREEMVLADSRQQAASPQALACMLAGSGDGERGGV